MLGKGQRTAYQTRDTLPERVVPPLDVMGFAGQLADGVVLSSGNHTWVDPILIRVSRTPSARQMPRKEMRQPTNAQSIFLVLGGLTPRTHISDDHRFVLTSTG